LVARRNCLFWRDDGTASGRATASSCWSWASQGSANRGFHARLAETPHTWVEWSASQLLQNTPLHPIAEWGRQRFGVDDAPAGQRLADLENTLRLVGLDPAEHAPLLAPLVDIPLPPERAARAWRDVTESGFPNQGRFA
jgi:hypothetical protein